MDKFWTCLSLLDQPAGLVPMLWYEALRRNNFHSSTKLPGLVSNKSWCQILYLNHSSLLSAEIRQHSSSPVHHSSPVTAPTQFPRTLFHPSPCWSYALSDTLRLAFQIKLNRVMTYFSHLLGARQLLQRECSATVPNRLPDNSRHGTSLAFATSFKIIRLQLHIL